VSLLYTDTLSQRHQTTVDQLRSGDPRALARAISTVENRQPGCSDLLKALFPHTGHARILGLTGAPGAGKNTLVGRLASHCDTRGCRALPVVTTQPLSCCGPRSLLPTAGLLRDFGHSTL